MKKALKNIYMLLGAWILVLFCPVVCCESEVLRNHQNIDIEYGSMFTRYTYWHDTLDDVFVIERGIPEDYLIISDNQVPIPCYLRNGDELYGLDGNYFGYIKVLKDGSLELRNCTRKSAMNGVYRAAEGSKARIK